MSICDIITSAKYFILLLSSKLIYCVRVVTAYEDKLHVDVKEFPLRPVISSIYKPRVAKYF